MDRVRDKFQDEELGKQFVLLIIFIIYPNLKSIETNIDT